MTYKGKEITEEKITLDVIKEIVRNYHYSETDFWNDTLKAKHIEDYEVYHKYDFHKVLSIFLKYLHSKTRKMEIGDIEKCVISKIELNPSRCYSSEYIQHMQEEKRKTRERVRRAIAEMELQRDSEKIDIDEDVPQANSSQTYYEQLKDKRWYAFRNFVFIVRGGKCEKCGSAEKLNIHHLHYVPGRKAWEYTCNDVQVLCKKCHKEEHAAKKVS